MTRAMNNFRGSPVPRVGVDQLEPGGFGGREIVAGKLDDADAVEGEGVVGDPGGDVEELLVALDGFIEAALVFKDEAAFKEGRGESERGCVRVGDDGVVGVGGGVALS